MNIREAAEQALRALNTCRVSRMSEWEVTDITEPHIKKAIRDLEGALQGAAEGGDLAALLKRIVRQVSDASYTQGIDERLDSPTRDEKNDSKVRALLGEASAAIDRLAALASKVQPKGKAPSLKADDYRAAWEAAKIAWARRTDAPKPWSALSFAEQLELVVDGANRAAAQCAAEGDATDWQAIARVQSAKLAVALDEPGARERLEAAMRSADWKADPQPKVADDSARLDWIAEHWFYTDIFERISFSFNECWDAGEHPNLRAAIDAAMAAVKPPVQGSAT